jgi:hypothetical protein
MCTSQSCTSQSCVHHWAHVRVYQLEKYQEQSQLLDPHLPGLVTPLAGRLRDLSLTENPDLDEVLVVSRALWAAATTR